VTYDVNWWKSEKDKRRDIEYQRALRQSKEDAKRRKEQFHRVFWPVVAAIAAMAAVAIIL